MHNNCVCKNNWVPLYNFGVFAFQSKIGRWQTGGRKLLSTRALIRCNFSVNSSRSTLRWMFFVLKVFWYFLCFHVFCVVLMREAFSADFHSFSEVCCAVTFSVCLSYVVSLLFLVLSYHHIISTTLVACKKKNDFILQKVL